MQEYRIDLTEVKLKKIYELGDNFAACNSKGETIDFTNYYMRKNGKAFFAISGEFHFSRMDDSRWEREIIKMKLGGINIVSTYVFWNHHEEEEGKFDFIHGRMINDNFCNGEVWQIGLKEHVDALQKDKLTIYITPLKEGAKVNADSAMAARFEQVDSKIACIDDIELQPVYDIKIF